MARPALNRPTDAELAILRVLWGRGPSTVRDVHEELGRTRPPGYDRPAGYTSVLKVMQIMTGKGLVRRDESRRTHVYRAAAPREHVEQQLVGDLLDRAFGGSAHALILRALSARPTPPEELAEIRKLIDEFRKSHPSCSPPSAPGTQTRTPSGGKP